MTDSVAFAALALAPLPAAHADINCPTGMVDPSVSPDCYFLHMMAVDQIFTADTSQADQISNAHKACADMQSDGGADPVMDVAMSIIRNNPGLSTRKAALVTGIAAAAYCPSVIRH